MIGRPVSKKYPYLLPIIKHLKIVARSMECKDKSYRLEKTEKYKHYKVYKNRSLLRRKLGVVDPDLQEAKIHNLKLAVPSVNNIVIHPGQTFSFWKVIGEPTYKGGYIDGMLLSDGKVVKGVGGGLCQLANLIHWVFLHTNLEMKEHWHHDYDVFPDSGRTIPFGSGAGVFYNYFDLRYKNNTSEIYTLSIYLSDKQIHGEVWSNSLQNVKLKIVEEGHRFYKLEEQVFRENTLFRLAIDKVSGNVLSKNLVKHNKSKVLYSVQEHLLDS